MNAIVSAVFPVMQRSGGYPFVFFALMMLSTPWWVLFVYPETKGITLEDMQENRDCLSP